MSNILTICYTVEGSTDRRFLENIIQRTVEEIAFDCKTAIEVYPVEYLPSPKSGNAIGDIVRLSRTAFDSGIMVLCIYRDADAADEQCALQYRINPGFEAVEQLEKDVCKNRVAIIPIHMSEAWMLADKELFKEEIGTRKSNQDLNIARKPEAIANPKQTIEEALQIAQQELPKKRQELKIGMLYQPLGQKIALSSLTTLESYSRFQGNVRNIFKKLNYLK